MSRVRSTDCRAPMLLRCGCAMKACRKPRLHNALVSSWRPWVRCFAWLRQNWPAHEVPTVVTTRALPQAPWLSRYT